MMATIAITRPIPPHRPASTLEAPRTPPFSLDSVHDDTPPTSPSSDVPDADHAPMKVPNKHLPVCPTGPARNTRPDTPPDSPNSSENSYQESTLYPVPDDLPCSELGKLQVYEVNAEQVAAALDVASSQPLPPAASVFPWFHGLHPLNHIQQSFFSTRRRGLPDTPCCLRGVTLVKADGDLDRSRLRGAVGPEEFMTFGATTGPSFLDVDPREGFSVRNFQIQPAKVALTSDIIVYGPDERQARSLAWDIASCQHQWREKHISRDVNLPKYNTFFCTSSFEEFQRSYPEVVAVDAEGNGTGQTTDFVFQERREMWDMSEATEISDNVFMGPSPEPGTEEEQRFDVLIECSDLGRLNPAALKQVAESSDQLTEQRFHDFPSSGSILPPTWSHADADGILETCKWIYHISHGVHPGTLANASSSSSSSSTPDSELEDPMLLDDDAASVSSSPPQRTVLLHCADGYTESTMLGIAYYSYSTGRPIPSAWLHLHTLQKRNFFAYPTDVALLKSIAPRLLNESPACQSQSLNEITSLLKDEPRWLPGLDGSFPSRILDYLYLGTLGHANNPDLLRDMGISQILSVGETAIWREGDLEEWGEDNICLVEGVQDNGIDPLTGEFERCLEFIDRGRRNGTATLVHCRVGVSRSATICIAEVMRELDMSFPRAYCFVRARRLNVIIQPHLRFVYELLQWEETLKRRKLEQQGLTGVEGETPGAGNGFRREAEWSEVAREIARMNKPYAR